MTRLPRNAMSLQQFMLRRQVLCLYRDFMKLINEAPENERKSMKDWVRQDFKNNMHWKNETDIKMQLSRGRLALREVSSAVHMTK
ncbi:LYR motif-containing protein 2-like isoform X2 [Hydractinia symbiolongicarpus]|uniref:LYR motif-containing protein 2-like isoform X2 n=1 Tax=Hydractinia symbiolongicarpus TaxID=13093 RepID=UPI00254C1DFF|nr:LYR motif-containing protein 2-like isoform X2 [Hydractinia symbiolongicarpus]